MTAVWRSALTKADVRPTSFHSSFMPPLLLCSIRRSTLHRSVDESAHPSVHHSTPTPYFTATAAIEPLLHPERFYLEVMLRWSSTIFGACFGLESFILKVFISCLFYVYSMTFFNQQLQSFHMSMWGRFPLMLLCSCSVTLQMPTNNTRRQKGREIKAVRCLEMRVTDSFYAVKSKNTGCSQKFQIPFCFSSLR